MIHDLFAGERISKGGRFPADEALLHTRPERRPPLYVSAFGSQAARMAGRWGDGLWTLADPDSAPEVIAEYRGAAEDAGREPGEILLRGMTWPADDFAAVLGALIGSGQRIEVSPEIYDAGSSWPPNMVRGPDRATTTTANPNPRTTNHTAQTQEA